MTENKENLFPTIGEVVEKTQTNVGADGAVLGSDNPDDEDEQTVQEIESLCMNCRENVCRLLFFRRFQAHILTSLRALHVYS